MLPRKSTLFEVLNAEPREHRPIFGGDVAICVCEGVVLLQEEPVLVCGVDKRPSAAQLLALQKNAELALVDAPAHEPLGTLAVEAPLAVVLGRVDAAVPHDDLAAAVLTLRDDAFKGGVLERVVLG